MYIYLKDSNYLNVQKICLLRQAKNRLFWNYYQTVFIGFVSGYLLHVYAHLNNFCSGYFAILLSIFLFYFFITIRNSSWNQNPSFHFVCVLFIITGVISLTCQFAFLYSPKYEFLILYFYASYFQWFNEALNIIFIYLNYIPLLLPLFIDTAEIFLDTVHSFQIFLCEYIICSCILIKMVGSMLLKQFFDIMFWFATLLQIWQPFILDCLNVGIFCITFFLELLLFLFMASVHKLIDFWFYAQGSMISDLIWLYHEGIPEAWITSWKKSSIRLYYQLKDLAILQVIYIIIISKALLQLLVLLVIASCILFWSAFVTISSLLDYVDEFVIFVFTYFYTLILSLWEYLCKLIRP